MDVFIIGDKGASNAFRSNTIRVASNLDVILDKCKSKDNSVEVLVNFLYRQCHMSIYKSTLDDVDGKAKRISRADTIMIVEDYIKRHKEK